MALAIDIFCLVFALITVLLYTKRGLIKTVDGSKPMEECYAAILEALGENK